MESTNIGTLLEVSLTKQHISFLSQWEAIIAQEESKNSISSNKSIWTIPVNFREKAGSCISNLVMCEDVVPVGSQYQYKMQKSDQTNIGPSKFLEGDRIIITTSKSNNPVGIGFLVSINILSITFIVDRVHTGLSLRNQKESNNFKMDQTIFFTMDQHGFSSGMGLVRNNIFSLFRNDCVRLRRLIVNLEPPNFVKPWQVIPAEISNNLNNVQNTAITSFLAGTICFYL